MNYHIITYGCQMNKSDSERIAAVLENAGYNLSSNINGADLIVVNMCSVRQSAVDRIYGLSPKFKKLKSKNQNLKTVLTGCVLKRDQKIFKEKFDYILNIKNLHRWPEIFSFKKKRGALSKKDYLSISPKYQFPFRTFIPISIGCDNFCTYCVVPYTRGPLISRDWKEILKETERAIRNGAKEIYFLGQNVNNYKSGEINFAKLLKKIGEKKGDFWIRFTSPHPKDFSEELIKALAKCKKITPYLNLPVQSGDNEILKRMNRPYAIEQYKGLIRKIRSSFKKYRRGLEGEVFLSTDIIVGFPGETRKQFENTRKLLEEIKFDMAYIAEYSPRPGTAAYLLKDGISSQEKKRRRNVLVKLLMKTALEKNKKFVGRIVEVFTEEEKNGFLMGKSRHNKTVKFREGKNLVGKFAKVKIIRALPWGLQGEFKRS